MTLPLSKNLRKSIESHNQLTAYAEKVHKEKTTVPLDEIIDAIDNLKLHTLNEDQKTRLSWAISQLLVYHVAPENTKYFDLAKCTKAAIEMKGAALETSKALQGKFMDLFLKYGEHANNKEQNMHQKAKTNLEKIRTEIKNHPDNETRSAIQNATHHLENMLSTYEEFFEMNHTN